MTVATQHPAYVNYIDTWETLRNAYNGSGAVKTARTETASSRGVKPQGTRYLPRPNGMRRTEQYQAYLGRATWYGGTERAVQGIAGVADRREPQIEAPASLDRQLEDVTQTGIPLRTFAQEAVRETLLMGRFGILVDFPQPMTELRVAVPLAALRPYWVAYRAEEIINWRTMQRQGDTVLSLVVLRECVPTPQGVWPDPGFFVVKDVVQYRVLRLDEAGHYEVSVWEEIQAARGRQVTQVIPKDRWVPTRNGVPLDFLPFCFLAPFSLEPTIEKSLLEAMVEINYRYYRHSADYEHALHLVALPTPYVCSSSEQPTEPLLIGSATAWWIADNQATVGMLSLPAEGLPAHQIALDNDIKDMAALGARLLEGAPLVAETATGILARTQGIESPIQSLITTVSRGLSQALQLHGWWAGATQNVDDPALTVTLNKDLATAMMDPTMLTALMQLLLNNTITYETFYFLLERGDMTRPGITADEEQALLAIREVMQPLVPPTTTSHGQQAPTPRQERTT